MGQGWGQATRSPVRQEHHVQVGVLGAWTKRGKGKGENMMDSKSVLEITFPGVADGLDGGGVEGREERPEGDTQVSGLSTWWVAVLFPEVGKPAGRTDRCRGSVWGVLGWRSLQIIKRICQEAAAEALAVLERLTKADSWSFYH